jgi:hypothetical protein
MKIMINIIEVRKIFDLRKGLNYDQCFFSPNLGSFRLRRRRKKVHIMFIGLRSFPNYIIDYFIHPGFYFLPFFSTYHRVFRILLD